jgi:hypothetical protein
LLPIWQALHFRRLKLHRVGDDRIQDAIVQPVGKKSWYANEWRWFQTARWGLEGRSASAENRDETIGFEVIRGKGVQPFKDFTSLVQASMASELVAQAFESHDRQLFEIQEHFECSERRARMRVALECITSKRYRVRT